MRLVIFIILALFFSNQTLSFSQRVIKKQAPAPPIPPRTTSDKLTKMEMMFLEDIEKKNKHLAEELADNFELLSKLVLNEDTTYLLRIESINIIGKMNTDKAQEFLIKNVDAYITDGLHSDTGMFRENIPIFRAIYGNNSINFYERFFTSDLLKKCHDKQKLELYSELIIKDYGKELANKFLRCKLKESDDDCFVKNIKLMISFI